MISTKDIYWLAGILEGEGAFTNNKGNVPRIQLRMTDEDVVYRAASIMGKHVNVRLIAARSPNRQAQFDISVNGRYAAGWMMTLYPIMDYRRQQAINQRLKGWLGNRRWISRALRTDAA